MKIQDQGDTLLVSEISELVAATASQFRDQVRSALLPGHKLIEVDLSQTRFLDSSGLGALIGLHKSICAQGGAIRLLNLAPVVQQIIELTRMHRVFEIVRR